MRTTLVILAAAFCLTAKAESDEAIVAAAEKLVSEAAVQGGASEANVAKSDLKESEIPVILSSPKKEKNESNFGLRLVVSLLLLVVTGGALYFASRRWTWQKEKGGKQTRIEIIHQMHLGPRKSLALLRVSGEVMLVGITDHNINMIKSLSLIDDELDNIAKRDFHGFLDEEFEMGDVRSVLGQRT